MHLLGGFWIVEFVYAVLGSVLVDQPILGLFVFVVVELQPVDQFLLCRLCVFGTVKG